MTQNKYLKTEVPNVVKDPSSGALLYTDSAARAAYKEEQRRTAKFNMTVDRVKKLESDVTEIKEMLRELLKR